MVIQQDFIHRLKNLSTCLVYEKLKDYSCVEYHAIHTHIIRYHPGGEVESHISHNHFCKIRVS